MVEKVEVVVLDSDASNEVPVRIPKGWTVEKFIRELKVQMKIPAEAQYDAQLKRTNTLLKKNETIEQNGIREGDIIRLIHTGTGGIW